MSNTKYNLNTCPKRPEIIKDVYKFMSETHCVKCNLDCEVVEWFKRSKNLEEAKSEDVQ